MPNSNSNQAPGQNKIYSIIVNGRQREVSSHKTSYSEVVSIAFPNEQSDANILYTVAYANPHGKDGTLVMGQDIQIKNGMSFNVSKTNRS